MTFVMCSVLSFFLGVEIFELKYKKHVYRSVCDPNQNISKLISYTKMINILYPLTLLLQSRQKRARINSYYDVGVCRNRCN